MSEPTPSINEYIASLLSSPQFNDQIVFSTVLPGKEASMANTKKKWPKEITKLICDMGIDSLYSHQAEAINLIRSGKNVVVATPTASGKTLIYSLPVFEKLLKNKDSRALYLFPLKALAQDQLRVFEEMSAKCKSAKPTAIIYDGDTSEWDRKKIRKNPPNVILTNPEMLHLSFLAYHNIWASFFSDLEIVVVDEVHTYRGLMGSNMALVFRRFKRICEHYGSFPTFIFSSATIANPSELALSLTGLEVKTVKKNGASQGRKHIVFIDPPQGSTQTAILLLKAALHRGLRTIVYTQSRKMTELIALWAGSKSGRFASKISAYRSGFLPEERREIESKLSSGELLAVVSTSALELGIDIGDLDLCLLVGYPGSVMATWQRSGRVGRCGQDSALILISGEDALDKYFMRNPLDLIQMEPESAVINPYNPEILSKHLVCAASELPLKISESILSDEPPFGKMVSYLEEKGELLRSSDGDTFYAKHPRPHRNVDLRGTGSKFNIICADTGENIGEIDLFRAFRETHLGAIYLHNGKTFLVNSFDVNTRTIKVINLNANYYTRVRSHKETEILEVFDQKIVGRTIIYNGRLKVTDQVTGYEKWNIHVKKMLNIIPLELPPQIFETEGIWFVISKEIQKEAESRCYHFMGGIHAVEHAAIGIFPLLVMTDRNDLGGVSITFHPQLNLAAIFIYDGVPGGAGLTRQAFSRAKDLINYTYKAINTCNCESGCPSCVHSPKCGSGNRPIDKGAAIFLLELLKSKADSSALKEKKKKNNPKLPLVCEKGESEIKSEKIYYGVLDIETQLSAEEVGGWHKADKMRVSCAILYDSKEDKYFEFLEDQIKALIEKLMQFDMIVGFNIKHFDYRVLYGYSDFNFASLPTLDILEKIHAQLGYRLSLDHLAKVTLGVQKSSDGLQALTWWKQGKLREIIEYCKTDVLITRDLFLYGRNNGYLMFTNKAKQTVRIPVNFESFT